MSTAVAAPPLALEMRSITKTYPGVRALEDVSFDVRPGEIHALVGDGKHGKYENIQDLILQFQRQIEELRL